MAKYIYIIALAVILNACGTPERETNENLPSSGLWMASQERYIQYVDSVPVINDDVTIFQLQPVENPYYDTIYNSSALILTDTEGDSLTIYSFPNFSAGAYLTESNGGKLLSIPEFNDTLSFEMRSEDSLVLSKKIDNHYSETFFHRLAVSTGSLTAASLSGTTWRLAENTPVEAISFLNMDTCLIRLRENGKISFGEGPWKLSEIEGRKFLTFYSTAPTLSRSVFNVHFLDNANPESLHSQFYMAKKDGEINSRQDVTWKQVLPTTAENSSETSENLIGGWTSAIENSDDQGIINFIRIKQDGTFEQQISGILKTDDGIQELDQTRRGRWDYNPDLQYMKWETSEGEALYSYIERLDSSVMILHMQLNYPVNGETEAFSRVRFTK